MRRHREPAPRVNHERWLVSYADFMTLLFAFFVVMFAVSRVDAKKLGTFQKSVKEATSNGVLDQRGHSPLLDGASASGPAAVALPESLARREAQRAAIRGRLGHGLVAAIDSGRLTLADGNDGVVLRLRDAAVFQSASATLRDDVLPDLEAIAATVRDLPNGIRIEGHTDPVPIRSSHFRSNWELSAARAAEVLALFAERGGIAEARLSVAGYGSQRPLTENDTEAGRAQNRRVDIVVIDNPAGENE
jgi:chemotaxis protein MotB